MTFGENSAALTTCLGGYGEDLATWSRPSAVGMKEVRRVMPDSD
jgi:hypothetical protein